MVEDSVQNIALAIATWDLGRRESAGVVFLLVDATNRVGCCSSVSARPVVSQGFQQSHGWFFRPCCVTQTTASHVSFCVRSYHLASSPHRSPNEWDSLVNDRNIFSKLSYIDGEQENSLVHSRAASGMCLVVGGSCAVCTVSCTLPWLARTCVFMFSHCGESARGTVQLGANMSGRKVFPNCSCALYSGFSRHRIDTTPRMDQNRGDTQTP